MNNYRSIYQGMDISIETETDQISEARAYRPARRERLLEQHAALAALTKSQVFRADNLDQTFRLLTETAARLLLIERVSLWRYTEDRSAIRCIDLYELSLNRHTAGAEFHSGLYPAYFQALATGEALIADDAHSDPRTAEFSSTYLTPLDITAMMDIPILVYGQLQGVLCYEQIGLPVPWLPEDRLFGIAVINLIVLAIEQSERKQAEAALRESEERYRSLVDHIKEVVFQTDGDGVLSFLNPAWTEVTGFPLEASIGTKVFDYVHPNDRAHWVEWFETLRGDPRDSRRETRFLTKHGNVRWVEIYARPRLGADGVITGAAGTFDDITERKRAEAHIQQLAYHDPLTGLPNRNLLMDRLDQALAQAGRNQRKFAVLFVDLDQFKPINDTFGHAAGDMLLRQVSARLKEALREEDTVARLGGDEFVIVLPSLLTVGDAAQVASKAITALSMPFRVSEHTLHVTASIGISIYPGDGKDRETLLKHADVALYQAKDRGRNTYAFFNRDINRQPERLIPRLFHLRVNWAGER